MGFRFLASARQAGVRRAEGIALSGSRGQSTAPHLHFEILLDGLLFPEGPRWHDGKLWFSDMQGLHVMTVDMDGNAEGFCNQACSGQHESQGHRSYGWP